jgi:protein-tyrosine phosphatase
MRLFEVETGGAGRLAIMARPRAGEWLDDEVVALKALGVQQVASLLTADETTELDLEREARVCVEQGLGFHAFPILDREVPSLDEETFAFLDRLCTLVTSGQFVAVHCRMGIGRSSLVAASVLALLGVEPEEGFARLSRARGVEVPDTADQRAWVSRFVEARAALGR